MIRLSARLPFVAGLLLLVTFGACIAENNQIGVLLGSNGEVDVLYVRCPNYQESVRTVRLRHRETDDVLWEIRDQRPISESWAEPELQRFTVGEVPSGFQEEVSLVAPLTEQGIYTLVIEGMNQEGFPYVSFRLDDLQEATVYGPIEGPTSEFIERASRECDPPTPPLGGFFAGRFGDLKLLLALVACVAVVMWFRRWFLAKKRMGSDG